MQSEVCKSCWNRHARSEAETDSDEIPDDLVVILLDQCLTCRGTADVRREFILRQLRSHFKETAPNDPRSREFYENRIRSDAESGARRQGARFGGTRRKAAARGGRQTGRSAGRSAAARGGRQAGLGGGRTAGARSVARGGRGRGGRTAGARSAARGGRGRGAGRGFDLPAALADADRLAGVGERRVNQPVRGDLASSVRPGQGNRGAGGDGAEARNGGNGASLPARAGQRSSRAGDTSTGEGGGGGEAGGGVPSAYAIDPSWSMPRNKKYESRLLELMQYVHQRVEPYEKGTTFTREQLLELKPEHIEGW